MSQPKSDKKQTQLFLSEALMLRVKDEAATQDRSISGFITVILKQYFENKDAK